MRLCFAFIFKQLNAIHLHMYTECGSMLESAVMPVVQKLHAAHFEEEQQLMLQRRLPHSGVTQTHMSSAVVLVAVGCLQYNSTGATPLCDHVCYDQEVFMEEWRHYCCSDAIFPE